MFPPPPRCLKKGNDTLRLVLAPKVSTCKQQVREKLMMNKKLMMLAAMVTMVGCVLAATPTITGVTAQQRYPWNGKVDISYTVMGDIAAEAKQRAVFTSLKVTAIDKVANTTNIATQLSGDTALTAGTHKFVWDMNAEGLTFKSSNVVFNVSCETTPATYCVIDLSLGANATSYPVTYLAEPPSGGFNVNTYKTTKFVLKRLEAGTYIMGEDQNDESHRVTLTKPFFCGLFEVTQKQYSLITLKNPSYFSGNSHPVEKISYNAIRGSSDGVNWPASSVVDTSSFMGRLRARTGLEFDLPTEAQWEYACRAGTATTYSYGDSANGNYMWYNENSGSQTHEVGTKSPNPWGLYDMHGNVWEWCLDWYSNSLAGGRDPQGPATGSSRRYRGGGFSHTTVGCRSSYRGSGDPASDYDRSGGFRLFRTLPADDDTICDAESEAVLVDLSIGTRAAALTERIRYSTIWSGVESSDAMAEVAVNAEMLNSATGNGYVDWIPLSNGVYALTHRVMSGGAQVGETLTATFVVEGLNPEEPVISPDSGTTFSTANLSVSMSCPTEGATIHYTTDGSDPTAESPVYKRFKISGKTTVKAVAVKNGMLSEVVTAEYALGQCADPVFSLADGSEFEHSNQEVSIAWNNDGVLRYTLDGSEPTAESPIYEGPFSFSESVVVKAKVFSDDFFDSSIVTANLTRVWVNVATPVVDAASSFTGSKTKVSISCATEGAVVRYTLNGNEPNSHSTKYTGPFYVTDSCTVKAYAVMPDYLNSEVATFAIEKVWTIGDTMGKPDHGFTTGGDGGAGWTRVTDTTAPNGEAMKSGAITHEQSSVLSTTVMGPGLLSFSWRTSCEQDDDYEWDHAELAVDGVVKLRLNGVTAWTAASTEITGDGEHTIEWRYIKDEVESEGEDAAWVANYSWASAWTATRTTEVPVPYAWLTANDPDVVDEYEAYEAAAKLTGANGYKVWENYAIGANPNDANDFLKITAFPMKPDGMPDFANITIYPPKSQWNVQGATPVLKGTATLGTSLDWQTVTDLNKASLRFFKIEVHLP